MTSIRVLNPFSRRSPDAEVIDHTEIRDLRSEVTDDARSKAAPQISVIGHTAMTMAALRDSLSKREAILTADIDRLTEDRRQTRHSLAGIRVALIELKDDAALTADERAIVSAAVDEELLRSIEDFEIADLSVEAAE